MSKVLKWKISSVLLLFCRAREDESRFRQTTNLLPFTTDGGKREKDDSSGYLIFSYCLFNFPSLRTNKYREVTVRVICCISIAALLLSNDCR